VFIRQAKNWREPAGSGGMGLKTYGMRNANALAHLMVIDAKTLDTKLHNWWASFIPSWYTDPKLRGAPNAAMIEQMLVLDDFSVAIAGAAATGYLQTPGAFWLDESPACAALASVPALPNAARHGSFPCHDLRRPV